MNYLTSYPPYPLFISPAYRWFFSHKKPFVYQKHRTIHKHYMSVIDVLAGFPFTPLAIKIPEKYLELAKTLVKPETILIAPGAGEESKCWPSEKFLELSKKLDNVSYILGPQDLHLKEKFSGTFPLQETEVSSPFLTMALASIAKTSICNDSGVGHLLACANKPMLSIARSRRVGEKWAPINPYRLVISHEDFGKNNIKEIETNLVHASFNRLLKCCF